MDNRHKDQIFPLYADFTFYGGIYRPVWLLYTEDMAFDRLTHGAQNVFIHQKQMNHERAVIDVEVNILNTGIETISDVPPKEMNGKVNPVTGRRPTTPPTLITNCSRNQEAIPPASNRPKR